MTGPHPTWVNPEPVSSPPGSPGTGAVMRESICGEKDCPTPYEFCEGCVRADERERIAQDLEEQGQTWCEEAARYRGYAEGASHPGQHRTAALVLDQVGTSLLSWAREYRKTRRDGAGTETPVQPGAIGPDAHARIARGGGVP